MIKIILFLIITAVLVFCVGAFFEKSTLEQKFKAGNYIGIVAICTTIAAIIGFVLVILF